MQPHSTLLFSPRTTYSSIIEKESLLFDDLSSGFDPYTIKILKKHFKEHLGRLTEKTFIAIVKRHLLNWHPEIENRELVLTKLLHRLFNEIDLNNNGILEWDEFTNYIIKSTNKENVTKARYKLENYSLAKNTMEHSVNGISEMVSYAFYIEKFNLVGIVHEGRSVIHFFDAETNKKKKFQIELKDTQKEIDTLEITELNRKSDLLLSIEKEERRQKQKEKDILRKKFWIETNNYNNNVNYLYKKVHKSSSVGIIPRKGTKDESDSSILRKIETPEKVKKEIARIKNGDKRKKHIIGNSCNLKLTVLSTLFINEYDTLLVSSTNNKISAWKYTEKEFKNVNSIDSFAIDAEAFRLAILTTDMPQYTMAWDKVNRYLYTGQTDGKILKWRLTKPNYLEKEILDINDINLIRSSSIHTLNTIDTLNHRSFLNTNESTNSNINKTSLKKGVLITLQSNSTTNINTKQNNKISFSEINKRDSVSCIIILQKMQLISAAYYNGNILLWDPVTKKPKRRYTDQETCIYQMCFDNSKNLLFTCGFDHKIFIYDPYVDGSAIYTLEGHNASINSISINEKFNELVSMDILGNIKIWDTVQFINFQTININEANPIIKNHPELVNKKKISSNLKLIFLNKVKKVLIYGDKFQIYQKGRSNNKDIADDSLILGCHYNPNTNDIITISLKRIKGWSIYTGRTKKIFDDLVSNGEILSYCFDDCMKRIYIGDTNGNVKNFNMSNGDLIKNFPSHKKEIVNVLHSKKENILISLSSDMLMRFNNDTELLKTNVIKEISLNEMMIKDINLDEANSMLVIGTSKGSVMFYDISRFRFDSEMEDKKVIQKEKERRKSAIDFIVKYDPITKIIFIKEINCVFLSQESSKMKFVTSPFNKISTKENNHLLIEFCYSKNETGPLEAISYNNELKQLYTGDRIGNIKCYDISMIYDIMDKYNSKELIDNLSKIQIKCTWKLDTLKESIKHLSCPISLSPMILLATTTEHHVKLISLESDSKSNIIDDLKQTADLNPPLPIAIKYSLDSILNTDKKSKQNKVIYREDVDVIHFKIEKSKMLKNNTINGNSIEMLEMNAKEKLIQATKGHNLQRGRSTEWNYDIDIGKVQSIKEEKFNLICKLVNERESEVSEAEKTQQKMSIVNENYRPMFLRDLSNEERGNYHTLISDKIRNVKLSLVKSQINQFQRKIMSNIDNSSKSQRKVIRFNSNDNGKKKRRISTYISPEPKNNFDYYESNFKERLKELSIPINSILERRKKLKLPKIIKTTN